MNKKLLVSFALASLTGISTQAKEKMSSETTQQRPNIILFMVDDMGWQDTSLPFWTQKTHYNETYETPNMERLAKKGMMFTQAYACNISSATRCSLITGANNTRHRVTNWTLEKNKATDRPSNTIQLPDWNYNGVSQVTGTSNTFVGTSFVELLRQNGYHTIHCGKAHFGSIDTPGENPTHWGFEVNIAGHAAGGLATYLSEQNYGHTRDGKPYSLMAIPGLEDYWGTLNALVFPTYYHLSVIDYVHRIRNILDIGNYMRRHYHYGVFSERLYCLFQLLTLRNIKSRARLVKNYHLRLVHYCLCYKNTLSESAR